MEVAGLALAIAGLTGQAISGLTTLKAFFAAYKAANSKVSMVNFELESLTSTLMDVERLLQQSRHDGAPLPPRLPSPASTGKLPFPCSRSWSSTGGGGSTASCDMISSNGGFSGATEPPLQTLERRVMLCAGDIATWSTASHRLNIGVWSDVRAFARKIKIATNKDLFDEIAARITAHRQAIGNSLSSLTLSTAHDNLAICRDIKNQLEGIASTSDALLRSHHSAESSQHRQQSSFEAALALLDTTRRDSHDEQMDLMRSMADNISSIASQLSGGGGSLPQNSGRNSPAGAGWVSPHHSPASMPAASTGGMHWEPTAMTSPEQNMMLPGPGLLSLPSAAPHYHPDLPKLSGHDFNAGRHQSSMKLPPIKVWSCSNVLGIDQLSSVGSRCLFCEISKKDRIMGGIFVDTVALGRHLVDDHSFGGCDLDRTYILAADFVAHVLQYHCGETSMFGSSWTHQSVHEKLQVFASLRPQHPLSQPLDLANTRELQPRAEQEESTATLLRTQICHLLQIRGLWPVKTDADGNPPISYEMEDSDIAGIVAALDQLESSADPISSETLYRTAMLVEEATISELLPGLSYRSTESAEHTRKYQLALGSLPDGKVQDDPLPPPFSHGQFIARPSPWFANCRSCELSAKMHVAYTSPETFKLHLLSQHGLYDSVTMDSLLRSHMAVLPLQVNPQWFPRILPDDSFHGRIDRWMLHCFLTSPNWRALFRTFTSPTHGFSCAMGDWSMEVLQHWKVDEESSIENQIVDPSDGAVNSRDYTASVASVGASKGLPRPRGTKRLAAYFCHYEGCSSRFETLHRLRRHMWQTHKTELRPRTESKGAGPHRCDRINPSTGMPCNSVFSRPYDLTRHEDTIHSTAKIKVKCELCVEEKTFYRADALTRHYRVVHPEAALPRRKYKCRLCTEGPVKYFWRFEGLASHFRERHPEEESPERSATND